MALIECSECGKEVSSKADSCPNCGNPMGGKSLDNEEGTFCPTCKVSVSPVVTNVGGGSCSVGNRITWKCPKCKNIIHKEGCFVATATYGDEDIVEVRFLRAFRDDILCNKAFGRFLVRWYYFIGPYISSIVKTFPSLKHPCRKAIDAIVNRIESHTKLNRKDFRKR